MAGSRAMSAREPGQVRKEAALSGHRQASGVARAGADRSGRARGTGFDGGCTVRFFRPAAAEPVARRPGLDSTLPCRRSPPRSTAATARARFADVVGQEHVVRTLRNAIEQDRVHHAYLFVGSRGTGKTSMAKILAASLNCVRRADGHALRGLRLLPLDRRRDVARRDRDGRRVEQLGRRHPRPAREGRLRAGLRPPQGLHPRRGAHAVARRRGTRSSRRSRSRRRTRSSCSPRPRRTRCCRRSSTAATASTSPARPSSRSPACCGAWPTRRGSRSPTRRCALIARSATGSFRDALGTLEQLVAYSGAAIALDDVLAVLGAADADLLFGAVDAVDRGRRARGAARRRAARRLRPRRRPLLRRPRGAPARADGRADARRGARRSSRVTAEQDERLAEQAAPRRPGRRAAAARPVAAALRAMKDGADARTQLELALVKGARPEHDPSLRALLARLERLEARPARGARRRAGAATRPCPRRAGRAAGRGRAPAAAPPADAPRPRRPAAPSRPAEARADRRAAAVVAASRRGRRRARGHRRRGRRARRRGLASPRSASASSSTSTASPSCGRPCSPTCRSARRCCTR